MNEQSPPCMFVAVYLALIRKGKVLLLQRQNTGYEDGNYGLIAGHVENNETITNAIIREVHEEVGISIFPKDLGFFHIMQRSSMNKRTYLDFFFTTENWHGKIKNMEPAKCSALEWFPLNDLPDNTIPYIRLTLQSYMKKMTYFSEHGL